MAARILVVDDEKLIRWALRRALEGSGHTVDEAATAAEARELVARDLPDLVLLDQKLPDGNGIEVLRTLRKLAPGLPVIMITAHASIGGAVEAMKEGVHDYVSKPFDLEEVLRIVARALETSRLREELLRHREEGRRAYGIDAIVAESPVMREVKRMIRRVASSEATTILLLGESGVGKGLVARALHLEGAARDRPFMHITCTALPEALLESELFGHEKGAFTDARVQKKGLLELADTGTVFLDEIGDLSPALQGKLLRFLEEKAFRRVGGTRDVKVTVRIIAATNKDMELEVREGRFRRDLYFRLKVIPLLIPSLRERPEDMLPLALQLVRHFNAELRKHVVGIAPRALELMRAYPWPGNVRELRNAIERAVLLTDGEWLTADDLPLEIRVHAGLPRAQPVASRALPLVGEEHYFELPADGVVLEELEKDLLRQALARARGNRTVAARLLGMNRDRVRYRIQKFRLEERVCEDV